MQWALMDLVGSMPLTNGLAKDTTVAQQADATYNSAGTHSCHKAANPPPWHHDQ